MNASSRESGGPGAGGRRVLMIDHVAGLESRWPLYRALGAQPGVELSLLMPASWIENYREVRAPASIPGVRHFTGRVAWRGYENRGFYVTGLLRTLLTTRPDVVHMLEEPFSLFALQATLLTRLLRPRARILFYTFDNLHRGFRYPYRPSWFYAGIQRIVQANSVVGTTGCLDARDVLRSRGFTRPIRFFPLALDPEIFAPRAARPEAASRPFVIGYVGRFLAVKGIPILLDAVARLEFDWRLHLVGDGPERASLFAQIRRLKLDDRVIFIAPVPPTELAALYGSMDVLVLPSVTLPNGREQFGRVLIEAMSCGTPVIGSRSGTIPEVVGDAGQIVPEGDPAALAEALRRLREEPAEARRCAARGVERVHRYFTWNSVAAAIGRLYAEIESGRVREESAPPWSQAASQEAGTPTADAGR